MAAGVDASGRERRPQRGVRHCDRRAGGAGEGDRGQQGLPREAYLAAVEASAKAGLPDAYLEQELMSDEGLLGPVIDAVLAAHADQVAAYRAAKRASSASSSAR